MGRRSTERPSEIFRRHFVVAPFPEENVERVVAEVGIEPIVFGSDFPHGEGLAYPSEYVGAQLTSFTDDEKRAIMRDNLAELPRRPGVATTVRLQIRKTGPYGFGLMYHVIHLADDVLALNDWYRKVFDAEWWWPADGLNWSEIEDRYASLLAVSDLCVETMAPKLPANEEYPGRPLLPAPRRALRTRSAAWSTTSRVSRSTCSTGASTSACPAAAAWKRCRPTSTTSIRRRARWAG